MKSNQLPSVRRLFARDRFTWLAYLLLACFAYLQASPGPIIPFLHAELHLNFTIDSLHLSGVALGMIVAGLLGERIALRWGRRVMLWGGAFGMLFGALLVLFSHHPALSILSMFVIGLFGALLMMTIQSALSDHHGEYRAVAITEANMLASLGAGLAPICLGTMVAFGAGWRGMLLVPFAVVLVLALFFFRVPVPEVLPVEQVITPGRIKLPKAFWLYWIALVIAVAGEWGVSFWVSGFLIHVVGIERTLASTLLSLFFLASVIGRLIGSQLTRRIAVERLLLPVIGVSAVGFLLFWLGSEIWIHLAGLFIAGLGISNLFPLTFSATANRIPQYSDIASARAAFGGGMAIFFAPLILGRIADIVGLQRAYSVILVLFILYGIFVLLASRATSHMPQFRVIEPSEANQSQETFAK